MRPIRALCVYMALVFLGGAMIAPWVQVVLVAAAQVVPALEPLAASPLHRVVNRSFLLLGLIGLRPFLRSLGMRSWREVGLQGTTDRWRQVGAGFLLGFASLAMVAVVAVGMGARTWLPFPTGEAVAGHLVRAALAALFVGFMEELFFRGALYGALRKSVGWARALLVSSVVYALVHFFQRPAPPPETQWYSGLLTLGQMLRGFWEWERLVPGFLSLLVAGLILGWIYEGTGSLYFSCGLHGGWIFWQKTLGFLTREVDGSPAALWGTRKIFDGWVGFGMLLVLAAVVLPRCYPARRESCATAGVTMAGS